MGDQSTRNPSVGCVSADNLGVESGATASRPNFVEGPSVIHGDVYIHIRYFTYYTDAGLVAGRNTSEMFTIDRPAKDVWPWLKDFNLWQNPYGYYYSGVVGDLEGKIFHISSRLKPSASADQNYPYESLITAEVDPHGTLQQIPYKYEVLRVVPEHLIVITEPIPEDGSTGGVRPGFHVFMLNEHDGKTVVTFYTEHCTRTQNRTEQEALAPFRESTQETIRKFRDCFIPTLKKLVHGSEVYRS